MPSAKGTKLLLGRSTDSGTNYPPIACLRSKSFTVANEPIDVTDECSGAYRELLAEPSNRTLDISASGLTKDDVLLALVMADTGSIVLEDCRIETPTGGTITGDFYITSYAQTGDYQDAVTFDIELQSSGTMTYAAAP